MRASTGWVISTYDIQTVCDLLLGRDQTVNGNISTSFQHNKRTSFIFVFIILHNEYNIEMECMYRKR